MAGTYTRCPNCGPSREGASVKRCRECGLIFCSECELSSWTATCPRCRSNDCATIGYIKTKSSGGGCFITTATLQNKNIYDDNCFELQEFRRLRDTYVLQNHPEYVIEYYQVAPKIVKNINGLKDNTKQFSKIWNKYLKHCLEKIGDDNFKEATEIYKKMVDDLKTRFINSEF